MLGREETSPSAIKPGRDLWLFSAPVDLLAFLGSAAVAALLLAIGSRAGILDGETPEWTWVPAVLLIDVAHVYATGFRVYFDAVELRRRPLLYVLTPLFGFVLGVALYSEGEQLFWRVLAYLAVFHFVRQQYGWVALYRAKVGERGRWGWGIDSAAIYLATLYPLIYWHAHLPRRFWWFLTGDFLNVPTTLASVVEPLYWTAMIVYAARSIWNTWRGQPNPGKDIVLITTAVCWYVGIVTFNSDYAFTVTNVIIHGVPYMVLVYWLLRSRDRQAEDRQPEDQRPGPKSSRSPLRTACLLLGTVWLLAYVETLLWNRAVWNQHEWLFGGPWEIGGWKLLLVPLLAVPQLTHYVLDGFIWKRRSNPDFKLIRHGASNGET